mgnify:CR=1 FL=1
MERYKDFTVDKERFPDLKKLVDDMSEKYLGESIKKLGFGFMRWYLANPRL